MAVVFGARAPFLDSFRCVWRELCCFRGHQGRPGKAKPPFLDVRAEFPTEPSTYLLIMSAGHFVRAAVYLAPARSRLP